MCIWGVRLGWSLALLAAPSCLGGTNPEEIGDALRDSIAEQGVPVPREENARLGSLQFKHPGPVYGLETLQKGSLLCSGGGDGLLRVWDIATGKLVFVLGPSTGSDQKVLETVDLSCSTLPEGEIVGSCDRKGGVTIWDAALRIKVADFPSANAWKMRLSPTSPVAAWTGPDGRIRTWNFRERGLETLPAIHEGPARALVFSPDGQILATAGDDRTVRFWNLSTRKEVGKLEGDLGKIRSLAFSPDGRKIVCGASDATIALGAIDGAQFLWIRRGVAYDVSDIAFRPDGTSVASGSNDGTIHLWDAGTGELLKQLRQRQPVYRLRFCKGGKMLASSSRDSSLRLWDVDAGAAVVSPGHDSGIVAVAITPDGGTILSGDLNGTVRLWDARTAKERGLFQACEVQVHSIAVSPDGTRIATSGADGVVRLWGLADLKPIRAYQGHSESAYEVDFSPNGGLLASAGADGTLRLWDVKKAAPVRTFETGAMLMCVRFSPRGDRLAGAGFDGRVHLYEGSDFRRERMIGENEGPLISLSFSPDGAAVAVVSDDGVVRLLEVSGNRNLLRLPDARACSVQISRDQRFLLVGGLDGSVRLYETWSGLLVFSRSGHLGKIHAVECSPDDRFWISGGSDATVLVWNPWQTLAAGDPKDLSKLVDTLSGRDGAAAFAASCRLEAAGDAAVAALADQLKRPSVEPSALAALLLALDAEDGRERDRAFKELKRMGPLVEFELRQALDRGPSQEARSRLRELLAALADSLPLRSTELLGRLRAVAVLERIGSRQARELLHHLSEQGSCPLERADAAHALGRLDRRR